ncbi:MAG TPA: aldo/keto reductase [Phycisphaerae bacterium]|nr:aldo/keto reductase [Phycisphaerae bacterium]
MLYRLIPGTDLNVSELCFGNFIYGSSMWGKGPSDEPEGIRLQNLAFELGVNFFDTGDAYDNGRAEKMMRETLRFAGRDKIILSTKFGYDFYTDPGEQGAHRERKQDFSPAFIQKALEESLKRLGVERIDLWQAHNIKLSQMNDELPNVMIKLQQQGKIRYWGIALGPAIGWREEGVIGLEKWKTSTVQTVFNMFEQHPGRELCELAAASGMGGIIARVPHSSGILQDIYTEQTTFTDHRKFRDRNWLVYGLKKVEKIRHIQKAHHCTLGQLAIKWLLTWPACVSVQPNITTEAELREFAAACDGDHLSPGQMQEIQNLVESDFGFGPEAHACDLKSSVSVSGVASSRYQRGEAVPEMGDVLTQRAQR